MSIFPRPSQLNTASPWVLRLSNCKFRVVVVADESLTRNECHAGIQKLFGAINRDEGEKSTVE